MADPAEASYLASRLGFTIPDLELNRAGQISMAQRGTAYWSGAGYLLLVLAGIAFGVALFRAKVSVVTRVILSVIFVPGLGLVLWIFGSKVVGAVHPRVVSVDGLIDFRGNSRGPPSLLVGEVRVGAPDHAREVLVKGRRYRLYYLAHSLQFLSIEPL